MRARTKEELILDMNRELRAMIVGVDWNFSQYIRDNVTEAMSGVKGDNAVKIFGPDLDRLEDLAGQVKNELTAVKGIEDALAVLRRDARTAVRHGDLHRRLLPAPGVLSGREADLDRTAAGGVLQRVGQEVRQDDAEPGRVAADRRVRVVGDESHGDLGVVEPRPQRLDDLRDERREGDRTAPRRPS
jgi:hypothetical protein